MKKSILSSLFPVAMLALSLKTGTAAAENFSFSSLNLGIPDGNPSGLVNQQTPATSVIVITGLTVTLNIAGDPDPMIGGWNGDLYAYVRHITPGGTGFTVLLNRVGISSDPSTIGYGDGGFNVTFDGAAANDIHLYQNFVAAPGANAQLTGTWQPDGRNVDPDTVTDATLRTTALLGGSNSFAGLSAKGDWTLFVADLSGGSAMTLNSWGLNIAGITTTDWYWKGATNNAWNTIGTPALPNWTTDATGATPILAIPDFTSDVVFSATGAANQNTVLGQNFTIHSLTINDPAAVTINSGVGGPFTLTIAGDPGAGIDVQAGAGLVTIGANVTLGGLSDTITVNNAAGLVINGTLGGSNGLVKAGGGTLTLTAANNYTGGTTLNAGTLSVQNNSALGGVAGGTLTINGGTLDFSGTNAATLPNPVTVANDFSVSNTATSGIGRFSGPIDLGAVTRTITSSAGTTDVNFSGVISGGAGIGLTLSKTGGAGFQFTGLGSNTYTGLTTLNTGLRMVKSGGAIAIAGDLTINSGGLATIQNFGEQIADTSTVTVNAGGQLLLFGVSETIGALNGAGTVDINSTGAGADNLIVGAGAFSGLLKNISGTGNLVKNTTGTFTLSGVNTYNGTTTVNEGTLTIDNNGVTTFGTLGTGATTANGGAAAGQNGGHVFFVGNAASAGGRTFSVYGPTFAGAGNGTVEFFNGSTAGTSTISNNGGTVAGGIGGSTIFHDSSKAGSASLTAFGTGVAGAFGGNIAFFDSSAAGGATLTAGGGAGGGTGGSIFFFNGSTGDTSRVVVDGNAKLDISLHSAPGVSIGSLEGSGNAFVGANNLTVGSRNLDTTFSGVIQDGGNGGGTGGSLTKVGTGTLVLTNANTYTGGTTINAGTLAAGNAKALSSGNLTMTGGTLRTTGGPLAVDIGAGNILFSGGTFVANVGGTSPGVTHDQLKTTGSANINGGTLALVQQNGYQLAPGDKVKLLSATGGVAGGSANGTAFPGSQVTGLSAFSSTPLLVPTVNLYTDSVILEAMQGSFAALSSMLGFTPNQLAVAQALDSAAKLFGSKTGLVTEFNFLDTQSLGTLKSNLDKIAPDELTAIFQNSFSLANVQTANLERRMDDIHNGAPITSAAGSAAAGSGPSYSGGMNGPQGKTSKEVAPPSDERWGAFLTGSGEFTRVGSTTNAAGYNFETAGVTGGLDYRVTDKFAIGLDFGYVGTTAKLVNGGRLDTDGGRLGIYATYFDKNFHVDAAVNGGLNSYKTRRITPNNTVASGSPDGSEVNILLATGYDWKIGHLTIGPTASYQYTNVRLDSFTETGAFAPLSVNGQSSESSRTALGLRATYDAHVGGVIVRPEARLSWQHEFGDTTSKITSRFANLGGNPFTVSGPTTGRDSMLIGSGFSVLWTPRFATYVYYDGEVGRTNYVSHNVSAGFRLQF